MKGDLLMYFEEHIPRSAKVKEKEDKVFRAVEKFFKKFGHSPSVKEVAKLAGIPSTSTTIEYLRRLKNKGLIDWEPQKPRTIVITQKSSVS
jgi:SOS-response transcriptional repressor LexA